MSLNVDTLVIERLKSEGLFEGLAQLVSKSIPSVGDVHVSSAGGDKPTPRKATTFTDIMAEGDDGPEVDELMAKLFGIDHAPTWPVERGFHENLHLVEKRNLPRALKPMDDDNAFSPFSHDPQAMDKLRPDQVPRFLGALTDSSGLETRTVRLNSLHAIQNRVDPKKVEAFRASMASDPEAPSPPAPPLVVRHAGKNFIADGHHRLAAAWLNGDSTADVSYLDLTAHDNALKRMDDENLGVEVVKIDGRDDLRDWEIRASVLKVDTDKRLMFGWASVVEKNGALVVDKQDDAIPPHELESAVYDYVRTSGEMDDMHTAPRTGDLVESMVFTKEKQQALGIHGMLKDADGHVLDTAWWAGWYVDNDAAWAAVKSGARPELSIGGSGHRVEV